MFLLDLNSGANLCQNVSQCTNGFVSPLYAPGTILGRAGVVFGHDLTTEAALTKLGYLLAVQNLSYADITAQMAHSIRGESKLISTFRLVPDHKHRHRLTVEEDYSKSKQDLQEVGLLLGQSVVRERAVFSTQKSHRGIIRTLLGGSICSCLADSVLFFVHNG